MEKTRSKVFYIGLAVITLIAFNIVGNLLNGLLYIILMDVLKVNIEFINNSYDILNILICTIELLIFAPVYFKYLYKKDKGKFNPSSSNFIKLIIIALGISGLSFVWIKIAEQVPALDKYLKVLEQVNEHLTAGSPLAVFITTAVLGPIIEEVVFRGIIQKSINQVKSGWLPIVISALVFGISHMVLIQSVYTFMMGLVVGYIYQKTENLAYPIIIHIVMNSIANIEGLFSQGSINPLDIFCIAMIIPMLYICSKKMIIEKTLVSKD